MTTSFMSDAFCTNTALAIAKRDAYFDGIDAGAWLFDTASAFGYPRQGEPTNGDLLKDIQTAGYGDGSVIENAGQSLRYTGNMIDFSDLTFRSHLQGPAGVLASIRGAGMGSGATATATISGSAVNAVTVTNGGSGYVSGEATAIFSGGGIGPGSGATAAGSIAVDCVVTGGVITSIPLPAGATFTSAPDVTIVPTKQRFLWCGYFRLPTAANWNTETVNASRFPLFQCSDETSTQLSQADLLTVVQNVSDGGLRFQRQTLIGFNNALAIVPGAADYGAICQLGYWKTLLGSFARLKRLATGASEVAISTTTLFAPNKEDFSTKTPKFGPTGGYAANTGSVWTAAQQKATKFKVGRGFIEDLRVTGRDPLAVLDADFARTLGRGVYS